MGAVQQDLCIIKGKTFEAVFGWAQGRFVWKPISAIINTAPVQITVVAHDIHDGWPYWISDLKKPACLNNVEIGCQGDGDVLGTPYLAEVVDADTLSVNEVNGMRLEAYSGGGGVIRYYEREDITGFSATLQFRRSLTDDVALYEASTSGLDPEITVDTDQSVFRLRLRPEDFETAAYTDGVYEVEIESPSGDKYRLAYGNFHLAQDGVR